MGNDGKLWFGYQDGIGNINLQTLKIKTYGYLEGFTPIQVYPNSVSKDKDGNLWWGSKQGAVKYNPKEDKEDTSEAIVHIRNINLSQHKVSNWTAMCDSFNQVKGLPDGLRLPYYKNEVGFEYIGIMFRTPEKVRTNTCSKVLIPNGNPGPVTT